LKKGQVPIHIQRWAPMDYHNDEHVKLLKVRQDWNTLTFYRHFIDFSFTSGGDLPADPEALAAIVGMPIVLVRRALKFCVGRVLFKDGKRLYQCRVRRDIKRELEFRESQRELGRQGGLEKARRLRVALGLPKGSPRVAYGLPKGSPRVALGKLKGSPSPPAPAPAPQQTTEVEKQEREIAAAAGGMRASARVKRRSSTGSSSSPPHGSNGNGPIERDYRGKEGDRRYIWHLACQVSVQVQMPTEQACHRITKPPRGRSFANPFDPAMTDAHAKASADLAEKICAEIREEKADSSKARERAEREEHDRQFANLKIENPQGPHESKHTWIRRLNRLWEEGQNPQAEEPWRES
jgi:hypothetical protein